ncbi:MFS transporter [Nocardiopsis ansamitocini]|uniref:MFS transporter n=1 Tax=Nocardiopsis ansamitocini TaxID=1670832 RepID=A0A9W6P733_9ACTN|nr:MFS transporter [Nocardiopsis ansamitocini]GLU48674.1 MFS transporter [Nocardiopsis ansamitocini]
MGTMKPAESKTRHSADEAVARWSPQMWGLLIVLAGNMLIDALEVSTVLVALPSVGRELNLSLPLLQWLVSGFALGFGMTVLFGGRIVESFGRRRVYLAALVCFAAASVIAGLTNDPTVLVATRFVKGVCAALTAPIGLAIISTAFRRGPDRDRAVAVYSFVGACGFVAGLLLAGLLTGLSWRLTFVFPAPVVLVLLVGGILLIPRDVPDRTAPLRLAAVGAVCLAGGFSALVQGVVMVPVRGWGDPLTLGAFAATGVLFLLFCVAEHFASRPLIRFGVLRNGALIRSMLGAAALNGSFVGLLLVATLHMQTVLGWSPAETAFAFLPASLPLAVAALFSQRLTKRFGAVRLIAVGALGPPLGYALYLRLSPPVVYAVDILPTMLLVAWGFVFGFAALNAQAVSLVPTRDRALASGLYQTAVQTAAAVVPALVVALLLTGATPGDPQQMLDGHRFAVGAITALGVSGLVVAVVGLIADRRCRGRDTTGRSARPETAPTCTKDP